MRTYADLPEPTIPSSLLACPMCGEEYSATRGDYWNRLGEEVRCERCVEPLRLVRKVTRYVQVRPWP